MMRSSIGRQAVRQAGMRADELAGGRTGVGACERQPYLSATQVALPSVESISVSSVDPLLLQFVLS